MVRRPPFAPGQSHPSLPKDLLPLVRLSDPARISEGVERFASGLPFREGPLVQDVVQLV